MLDPAELENLLGSKKAADRLKAAKLVGQNLLKQLEIPLLAAYLKEKAKDNSWKNQYEMLVALGLIGCKEALQPIHSIIRISEPHDMVTYGAAQSYVRLLRTDLGDATPILELLETGRFSTISGALIPLGYDRMMPSDQEIELLLQQAWNYHLHPEKTPGTSDPRYPLAAACAGWNPSLTKGFLLHCIDTANGETGLVHVAQNSIKGKYVRLR